MSRSDELHLRYVITKRHPFVIVSFSGTLTKQTVPILEDIQEIILQESAKWVIHSFADVKKIEVSAVPGLVRLQRALREQGREIRFCCLSKDFKGFLLNAGAIRHAELSADLSGAVESLAFAPREDV